MKFLLIFFSGSLFLACSSSGNVNNSSPFRPKPSITATIPVAMPTSSSNTKTIITNLNSFPSPSATPKSEKTMSDDERVFAQIKAKVKQDFADDYVMQKFAYGEQVKAYKYMKTISASSIKSKAQNDFPDDYVMQKFAYEEQTKAKKEMDEN
jgi:hypothetical protein